MRVELFAEFPDGRRITDARIAVRRVEIARLLVGSSHDAAPDVAPDEVLRRHIEELASRTVTHPSAGTSWEPLLEAARREGIALTAPDLNALPLTVETDTAVFRLLETVPADTAQTWSAEEKPRGSQ